VYSHLGTSHQSTEDIACTRAIAELTVLSPADRFEMAACMALALQRCAPVYLRMGKSDCGDVHPQALSIAAGELVKVRSGHSKVALLATGSMVSKALAVCAQGLDAEVWSVPCIKPLSATLLTGIAAGMDGIVTLEEHSTSGGLGSCVTEALSQHGGVPVLRLGIEDRFSSQCGSWDYLLTEHGLDLGTLSRKIHTFVHTLPGR